MVTSSFDDIASRLGPMAVRHGALAPLTTYRLGGPAAVLVRPTDRAQLAHIAAVLADHDVPVLVVGRGSNLLIADEGFAGVVVVTADLAERIDFVDERMVCSANVLMPVAARRSVAHGLTGFEWAVGVPGSVGGGVRMNAGGHGSDIAAALVRVTIFDVRTGRCGDVASDALGLRFRGSALADTQLVVEAELQLAAGDVRAAEAELAEIVRWRREHQPGGQNAGSVFVNPVPGEVAAGQLIDAAGLRGWRVGGAVVSEKHANFIQAEPGATAADVRALIEHVRAVVAERCGYVMRSEIRHVGWNDVADEFRSGVVW